MPPTAPTQSPVSYFGQHVGYSNREQLRTATQPLLSLCIPTYNQANKLRSLLHSVVGQCAAQAGAVEIVVSDDASSDNTPEVVAEFQQQHPLVYSRNSETQGASRNLHCLTSVLTRGTFCWLLNDDALVLPDGVARLLEVIKTQEDIHFIFANSAIRPAAEYEAKRRNDLVHSEDILAEGPLLSKRPGPSGPCCFDELIDPAIDTLHLGAPQCGVFRTATWRLHDQAIASREAPQPALANAYPQAMIHACTQVGRKAYYVAEPVSLTFTARPEDSSETPQSLLLAQQELLALYESKGIPSRRIQGCRKALVSRSGEALAKLMLDPSVPGHAAFDLQRTLKDNESCAQVLFAQLDLILSLAQKHGRTNRHLETARALIARYPNNRETPLAAPGPRSIEGFKACVDKVPELVHLGRVEEAVSALNQAKALAPTQECVQLVLNYFALFVRKKIFALPTPQRPPRR